MNKGESGPEADARRSEKAAAKVREAVRVFPDYANTVIWYARGPVPYEETGLSLDLIGAMDEWETAYYASLDESYSFASPQAESDHVTRGLVIAKGLSEEIGDILPVEADAIGGGKTHLLTPGAGTNPEARASFAEMRADAEAEAARVAAMLRTGAKFDLRAHSDPRS